MTYKCLSKLNKFFEILDLFHFIKILFKKKYSFFVCVYVLFCRRKSTIFLNKIKLIKYILMNEDKVKKKSRQKNNNIILIKLL